MVPLPTKKILELADVQQLHAKLELLNVIPKNVAQTTQTVAFDQNGQTLYLLTTNNFPELYHQVTDKLQAKWYKIDTYYTDADSFALALDRYQQLATKEQEAQKTYDYRHNVSWHEAITLIKEAYQKIDSYAEGDFINEILRLAFQSWASDVHFQSEEMGIVMRVRKDGILQTVIVFDHAQFQKYLMKIKYIAGVKMNIEAQTQDGRFDFDLINNGEKVKVDVRVSVMPSLRGESLVLRFLDSSKGMLTFEQLWFEKYQIDKLHHQLKQNYGLILVTGPTGSGKTTTVYSMLNTLNSPTKKIITIEDPVEYELPGIEQSQINEKKWFSFEEGLKGILRHDPDIIMVGEIRTLKSAEMAVNAALTGHLVISTIHTNNAVEALTRLINMWVKPFMLASALNCIIGQRLVRKTLKSTKALADEFTDKEIRKTIALVDHFYPEMKPSYDGNVYHVPNNEETNNVENYEWREGIFEILEVDPLIKEAIIQGKSAAEILELARKQGFLTIKDDAYLKMIEGKTSLEEIMSVI